MFLNRHRIDCKHLYFSLNVCTKSVNLYLHLMKSIDVCKTCMMKEIMCTFNHEIINFEWHINLKIS